MQVFLLPVTPINRCYFSQVNSWPFEVVSLQRSSPAFLFEHYENLIMKYSDKLRDPLWQRKRLFILTRDAFKCQMCGDEKTTLNVHHRHYLLGRDPWDYPDDLLITLCEVCHKKEEVCATNAEEIFNTLHHWGYFNVEIISELNKLIEVKIKEKSTYAEPYATRLDEIGKS